MDVDHIVSRHRGGAHAWGNVQLLCRTCNLSKGGTPQAVFLQKKVTLNWEYEIKAAAISQANEDIEGEWGYSLECGFFLNARDTDPHDFPSIGLLDLSKIIRVALTGVIWKHHGQVAEIRFSKRFADPADQQRVQIAINGYK